MKNGKEGWMESIVHGALAICNRSSYKDVPFAIHAAGCPDVEKERRRNGAVVINRTGTLSSAVEYVLDAETREMGYDESHVRIFPCCKAAVSLEPRYEREAGGGVMASLCSYWQRQQGRDADDNGFGFSPWELMTPAQAETHQAARDAEDEKDPPCGKCSACAESQAQDELLPEAYR